MLARMQPYTVPSSRTRSAGRRFRLLFATCIALCLLPLLAQAQGRVRETPRVVAVRADEPPKIDGKLDEAAWSTAGVIDQLYQTVPVAYAEPSQQTRVLVLYDADNLYIGIRAYDTEPEKIVARAMVRDGSLRGDDRVAISIDTLNDQRNGYFFAVNPIGNRRDALIDNGSAKFEWDGIWYADATIDAEGYSVEMAIPFKTLSIDPEKTTWGLQVTRGVKRINEEIRWASPTPEIANFNMSANGRIDGLVGMQQG